MREALQRAWLRRGLLAWLLWPFSLVYGVVTATRRWLYRHGFLRTERAGVPVVVVGNVVAGGSGKTPVVMALVAHLRSRGLHPGVVSRGHGRAAAGCREVFSTSEAAEVGDEPLLIAQASRVPVFVARRRIDAIRALVAAHPGTNVIVCDDGLQHYALHRDIEICVFGRHASGNGFLLPAGPLRESPRRPVDFVLRDAAAPLEGACAVKRELAAHAVRINGSRVALADLRNRKLFAVAGIANPQGFFDMLTECGLRPEKTLGLADHHDFGHWQAPDPAFTVVCTEKDAVKLWARQPDALAIPLVVLLPAPFLEAFDRLLDARLSSAHGPQTS